MIGDVTASGVTMGGGLIITTMTFGGRFEWPTKSATNFSHAGRGEIVNSLAAKLNRAGGWFNELQQSLTRRRLAATGFANGPSVSPSLI